MLMGVCHREAHDDARALGKSLGRDHFELHPFAAAVNAPSGSTTSRSRPTFASRVCARKTPKDDVTQQHHAGVRFDARLFVVLFKSV